MSSSDTNNFDIGSIIEELLNKNSVDPISEELLDMMKDFLKEQVAIVNTNKVTSAEITKLSTAVRRFLDVSGAQTSKQLSGILNSIRAIAQKQADAGRKVNLERLIEIYSNRIASAIIQSMNADARGSKNAQIKNLATVGAFKPIVDALAKKLGVKGAIDSGIRNLMSFYGELYKKQKKDRQGIADYLLDGLAKNKYIGGALNDTTRLLGFLGASFLSKFGNLGRVLGAAFYVAMTAAGPVIVSAFLKGMSGLVINLGRTIGGFISRKAIELAVSHGGSLGELATASTFGQKAVATAKVTGALGGAALGIGGAIWAGRQASDSWQQGRKGNAVALGTGAAALGAGGIAAIASLFTAAAAPFVAPLLLIGGAVAGIALAWKNHSETIKKWGTKVGDFFKKVIDFIAMFNPVFAGIKWLVDHFSGKGAGSDRQDRNVTQRVKDLELNKYGGMTNIRSMDKNTASSAVQSFMRLHPNEFNSNYENVGSDYAHLGSFVNDLAIRDAHGEALEAVLYKGASANLGEMWNALVAEGKMSRERAELLKYTSGRSTASSKHKKGGAKSHDNFFNLVTDLGTNNEWTDAEWETAYGVLQPLAAAKGFNLQFEGNDKYGSTKIGGFTPGLSNRHFHIGLMEGKEGMVPTEESFANEGYQKAVAQAHSIEVKTIMEQLEPKTYENINKWMSGASQESIEKAYEKALKNLGYSYTNDIKGGMWMKEVKGDSQLPDGMYSVQQINDPTGNDDFRNVELVLKNLVLYGSSQ